MRNHFSEDEVLELINQASAGNKRAFELIVRIYQKYAYAVAFKILLNEDDTKEIVQETFIRIWKHLGTYDNKIKFSTWMYKIVVNLCYDKLKSRKRKENIFRNIDYDTQFIEVLSSVDLEKEFSNREYAEIIKRCVNGLTEKQRMVFILRIMEDLTVEETAKILDISASSVKTNLFFARQNLRAKLIGFDK